MKKVSNKQKKINNKLKKVYREIAETRGHYCTGCGRSDVPLSHSHIIPRSRRKDLELDPRNITYHCLSIDRKGCHELWEGTTLEKQMLLDYHKSLEYILEVDTEYYFLISE
jgi:diadenosine tetraphosphate (Ap4A) HIT family hydrolase